MIGAQVRAADLLGVGFGVRSLWALARTRLVLPMDIVAPTGRPPELTQQGIEAVGRVMCGVFVFDLKLTGTDPGFASSLQTPPVKNRRRRAVERHGFCGTTISAVSYQVVTPGDGRVRRNASNSGYAGPRTSTYYKPIIKSIEYFLGISRISLIHFLLILAQQP